MTWRGNRWSVVAAAVLGLAVGAGAIKTFTFGIFLKPLVTDLGFSRGTLSLAFFLSNIFTVVGLPILGWCIDRYGIRRTMLPWVAAFAVATAAQGFMPASLVWVYALFSLGGFTSTAQTPLAYTKAIAAWFDEGRGFALGIGVAGVGIGTALVPPLTQALISAYGWRAAYVGLGCLTFLVAMPTVAFLLREPADAGSLRGSPGAIGRSASGPVSPTDVVLTGLTAREALTGSWRFWAISVAFLISTIAINGVLTGMVPLLTDRGDSPAIAATVLSAAGICLTIGRIVGGIALDRFFAPLVAAFFFVVPLLGIALLHADLGGVWRYLAGVFCGLGIGAEVDIAAYLASRYFGLRAFGALYGCIFAMISLANAAGPFALNLFYDVTGSYDAALLSFEALLACAVILILPLGPYRFPARGSTQPRSAIMKKGRPAHSNR